MARLVERPAFELPHHVPVTRLYGDYGDDINVPGGPVTSAASGVRLEGPCRVDFASAINDTSPSLQPFAPEILRRETRRNFRPSSLYRASFYY